MSISRRIARGLWRAAPTGALTILWGVLGATGFMAFFQDTREVTLAVILFIMVFGVGVWIPYFRFFFLFAEETMRPEGPRSAWDGVHAGALVAALSLPPIILIPGAPSPDLEFLICAPITLMLVGWNRGLKRLDGAVDG